MKRIKDGYISFINSEGTEESEWFGGFELVNKKPKQIKVTKTELKIRMKQLEKQGCEIRLAEICTYECDNDEYAELIDPIKRDYIYK